MFGILTPQLPVCWERLWSLQNLSLVSWDRTGGVDLYCVYQFFFSANMNSLTHCPPPPTLLTKMEYNLYET